jgi:uncharacterized protein (TIGR02266 family)
MPDSASGRDRRVHERLDAQFACSVRDDLDRSLTGVMMQNLSMGGCFVTTERDLPQDGQLTVSLDLPELDRVLRFSGTIVWRRSLSDGRAGVGIQFVEFQDSDLELLRRYLTELSKERGLEE